MKLISWNVNGIRACLNKGFLDFFNKDKCRYILYSRNKNARRTNRIKTMKDIIKYWNSAEKKGYSGTAIFTKVKPLKVFYGMGIEEHDKEGRVITLEFDKFYMVNVYTPNSKRELERLRI